MRLNLLEGVRVVEIGAMWAGPYAARIMGDLGAEVIKLESPRKPEPVRFGYYPGADPGELPWERGGHFQKFGRNKKSLILDITSPRGRELLYALLRKTDVLIENNTPRVREHLGIGHADLARECPELVVVSMPGFGDTGPYRDYLAFGLNIEGFTGISNITGYADGTPPIRSAIPYGDPVAALYGALTAILGLRERRNGGTKRRFEVSQHEGLVSLLPEILLQAQVDHEPQRTGNADPMFTRLQGTFADGAGGWLSLTVNDDTQLWSLLTLIGGPGLEAAISDGAAEQPLRDAIERWIAAIGADAAVRALWEAGIAAGPVLAPSEMMRNEQVVARGVYSPVPHPVAGDIPYSQLPLKYARAPSQPDVHAPLFGEHNRQLFRDVCGLSDAEIDELYATGLTSNAPDMG
ncbi:hypothetical protein AYO38_04240 [bacterium SCGC AG-212-C10]|nr:hypothetical protein AYO38_04240 [bacterium SCGC AG-212-C10]